MQHHTLLCESERFIARELSQSEVPVNLLPLAKRMNVKSIEAGHVSGRARLEIGAAGHRIVYDRRLSPAVTRYCIAHELAHAVFFSIDPVLDQKNAEIEHLADQLAATMLMPKRLLHPIILPRDFAASRLVRAAAVCNVSLKAMAVRCHTLYGFSTMKFFGRELDWTVGRAWNEISDREMKELFLATNSGGSGTRVVQQESKHTVRIHWHYSLQRRLFVAKNVANGAAVVDNGRTHSLL